MTAPMHYPASRRQYIQRVPAYLPVENKISYSPLGSCRTTSADSKSASISSGYGTPKVLHGDSYYRQHPSQNGSTSSEAARYYYLKNDAFIEDNVSAGKKRSYNAVKRRSSDVWYMRNRESSVPTPRHYADANPPIPPRRQNTRRHPTADIVWSYEGYRRPTNHINRRHPQHSVHAHHHHQCPTDYYPDPMDYWGHPSDYRNSAFLSSSSSESWDNIDRDLSPVGSHYPPSPIRSTKPGRWKSENNLFDPLRFKVDVSTLDEESAEIYNELLDVAGSLAYEEHNRRLSGYLSPNFGNNQRKPLQRYKSLYDLPTSRARGEHPEAVPQRNIPKPFDRRSRRSDQERTPTNISSPWVQATYLNETVDERFHHTPDSDTESALAALDNALNFNFHTPVVERNSDKRHSVGPVPIIREYIGETEEDWLKQQRRYESTSPEVFSVIEIDESSEDEDRRRAVALPLDDLESKLLSPVHALHIDSPTLDSGSFSLRTPPEDSCYMSDIDA